jgi:hypothetical protein
MNFKSGDNPIFIWQPCWYLKVFASYQYLRRWGGLYVIENGKNVLPTTMPECPIFKGVLSKIDKNNV